MNPRATALENAVAMYDYVMFTALLDHHWFAVLLAYFLWRLVTTRTPRPAGQRMRAVHSPFPPAARAPLTGPSGVLSIGNAMGNGLNKLGEKFYRDTCGTEQFS